MAEIKARSLSEELTAALPENFHCRVRYVRSAPKPCDPLFSPPPDTEPEMTRLASHFLTVSSDQDPGSGSGNPSGVLLFGVEALVYTTKHLTTIFVSKADSTGYLQQQRPSPVKTITTTFLHWLSSRLRRKNPTRKLVMSLFARSQSQYLFPGSAENPKKHVLDDRQLIKWWARVLDPILPKEDNAVTSTQGSQPAYEGYITAPGYEGNEIRPFLPPNNTSTSGRQRWRAGNPLSELAETRGVSPDAQPRSLLPRFPDDPKARFMQDLDNEVGISGDSATIVSPSKRKSGKWTSIRNLDRFWEAMEFRQECSSGRVVGFLWLVIRPILSRREDKNEKLAANEVSQDSSLDTLSSDPAFQLEEAVPTKDSLGKKRRMPRSGPIIPRQPRLKGGSSSLTATSELGSMLNTEAEDGLVLSKEGYDKTMQKLLHLGFSNLEVARQSTSKWVSEVMGICGIQSDWALDVVGNAKPEEISGKPNGTGNAQVNDLGGMIRKKRKAGDEAVAEGRGAVAGTTMGTPGGEKPAVNLLSGGMVRKKPKTAVA